jgi:hypothetical protein
MIAINHVTRLQCLGYRDGRRLRTGQIAQLRLNTFACCAVAGKFSIFARVVQLCIEQFPQFELS